MKKQLWTIAMAVATMALMMMPTTARADGEACFSGGEHVNPADCSTECCSKNCNGGCATDGH